MKNFQKNSSKSIKLCTRTFANNNFSRKIEFGNQIPDNNSLPDNKTNQNFFASKKIIINFYT